MKRIFSLLLVAVLVLSCFPAAFAAGSADASVSKSQTVEAGDVVTLTVTVTGEFSNYEMKVTADSGLTITAITGVTANVKNGKVAFSSGVNVTEHSFTVTVKVADDAKAGKYSVTATPTYGSVIVPVEDDDEDGVVDGRVRVSLGAGSATLTVECVHAWGEWVLTKAPTCAEKGEETSTCANCGEKKTRDVAKLDHAWGEWIETKAPTCTEKGEETKYCANCGETRTQEVAKKGHAWGEWKTVKAATCTEDGLKEHICSVCGEKETAVIPAADGHAWGEWQIVKAATCTEDGEQTRTCSACGEVETQVITAAGHAWAEEWTTDETHHWHVCTVCGEKCEHNGEHTFGEWTVTKEATNNADGEKVRSCSICSYEDVEAIPATGDPTDPPKTGDMTTVLMFGGLSVLLLLLIAALYYIKRKASAVK